jgi:hypothetical protein
VTGPNAGHHGRLGIDGALLRRRLADVAASIARTEDQVAETLERMALALPDDAIRLQAQAQRARRFATLERDRATSLGLSRQPRQAVPLAPPG